MPPNNPFDMAQTGPATSYEAVTPLDSSDLGFTARAMFIGGAGNLKFETAEGVTFTAVGLLGGQVYPFANITKVYSGDTTATDILALR